MGKVLSYKQCPQCLDTGMDNLAVYEDGVFCHACSYSSQGIDQEYQPRRINPSNSTPLGMVSGASKSLEVRGISKDVCEFFGYQVGTHQRGELVHIANYYKDNELLAQKIRTRDKKFYWLGNPKEVGLYGQWLWPNPSPNIFVTVVEGEIDALSVAEARGCRFPVVSIPNGASKGGTKKDIQKSLEWLMGWKYVVFAFDSDRAGKEALEECQALLEPGKVRVVKYPLNEEGKPYKDMNQMLVAGKSELIQSMLFNAEIVAADGIVSWDDVQERILVGVKDGIPWPWKALNDLTHGIYKGELTVVTGGVSLGKTEFISDVLFTLLSNEHMKCGLMSFEQPPWKTFMRMVGKFIGKRIHESGNEFNKEEAIKIGKEKLQNKLFCYEKGGSVTWEQVRNKIIYFVNALGCEVVVIDNLSSLSPKFDKDERIGIDRAMSELQELTMDLNIIMFLVAHLSYPPKGPKQLDWDQGRQVTLSALRGSNSIGARADNVFALERNVFDPELQYITTVRCLKARDLGFPRGATFEVMYSHDKGRLIQC